MSAHRSAATVGICISILAFGASSAAAGEWLAGDLHVHTTYSHDSYGGPGDDNTGPDDANTFGFTVGEEFQLAATRGLDYVAITDHNDVRSQTDPGFGSAGVMGVPAYENSLKTHAQMLGATQVYDNGDAELPDVLALVETLHADGGVFQVNHPASPDWVYGYEVPADTSEVWNLPWYYQPPFPVAADNDKQLRFWQLWLDRGAKVAATGGSDSHWVATSAAQGVGQPTTWVYADEATPAGVLAGLRAGHTFISHQPPAYAGPQTFLEADADGDGEYESMVGDTVPPGTPLRVRVSGAPGAFVRIVTDGGVEAFPPVPVTSSEFEHEFVVPDEATWVHAQLFGEDEPSGRQAGCAALASDDLSDTFTYCTNRVAMLGLTSAIYLEPAPLPCLARRARVGRRHIGRVRLGFTRERLLQLPVRTPAQTRRSFRFCVKESRGYTAAVFSGRSSGARAKLLVTTARGLGNRHARVGSRGTRFRQKHPNRVRVSRGLYRGAPRSPRLYGLRGGRVRFMAVATRGVAGDRKVLRRYLRLSRQR